MAGNTMTHAEEARIAAAQFDHPWDAKALDWPLTTDSVVIEVGGYKGRWALQMAERYRPRLYVFEPQGWAAAVCEEVLGDRAVVLNFGLGIESRYQVMDRFGTDGCTFAEIGTHMASLTEVSEAFTLLDLTHIDLMLINIEGYEYTLIPHMLDQGIYPARLMVQFHTFADPDGMQQAAIYEGLARAGYRIAWAYGVVLTAWERGI